MSVLSKPYFHDEAAAFAKLEEIVWPNGPICPHCGGRERIYELKGKSTRQGLKKCGHCRKQFTVRVGTVFESSHIPLHKWFQAAYLMASSKKGISAHQLHRTLEITYKSAWFMAHRLREAMRDNSDPMGALGGQNKVVEADETYVGGKAKNRAYKEPPKKEAVVSLVERDGRVKSFHLKTVTAKTLRPILVTQIDRKSYLMTDESLVYIKTGEEFAGHGTVNHSVDEYVRHGSFMHTNTVESFFSLLKRGLHGAYHHVSQQHLKRYLAEFDFRHNARGVSDAERSELILRGIGGKRLVYEGI
ncbi:IS1595 family transposase [Pacificispira sp.]|uniref:IS1595 family transposase n=1 Tax=Pacificispira sp. TaxID=2888761 RepID=UPI003BAAD5BA